MSLANIVVKELNPQLNDPAIPLNTIISFRLSPFNSDVIDITTLALKITINGPQGTRVLNFTEADTDNVTYTANGDSYDITLDVDPDDPVNFNELESVRLQIDVDADDGDHMKTFISNYTVLSKEQLGALQDLTSYFTEITVEQEQGRLNTAGTVVDFTWSNWTTTNTPEIYVNGILTGSGYSINYPDGKLTFSTALSTGRSSVDPSDTSMYIPEDIVSANYKFGFFTDAQLMSFMKTALNLFNASWPQTNFTVNNSNPAARMAMVIGGAYFLYGAVVAGFINQQTRVPWGEDEWQNLRDTAKMMKENMKEDFKDIKETKQHTLARPMGITVPSYTLPGGRSRFFGYIFGQGGTF